MPESKLISHGIQRKRHPVQGLEGHGLTTEYNHPYPEWSDPVPAEDVRRTQCKGRGKRPDHFKSTGKAWILQAEAFWQFQWTAQWHTQQLNLFSVPDSGEEPIPELIEPEFIELKAGKRGRKYKANYDLLNHLGMLFTSKIHIYKKYQNNYRTYGILLQVYYYFWFRRIHT